MPGGFGEQIEDYEVLNLLGKGGFASVYKAKCLCNGMEVAIKMIDKKSMQAAGMLDRVFQEVTIHSRLKHPAILEVYTVFEDNNYVYMILELCHNGELQNYLKKQKTHTLSEQEAGSIIAQVVQGLLFLHSHLILHRDISLSNLLLTKNMQVKIADFGLATQLKRPDEKHLTMCGTPNYISPEVATRSSHGLAADVWSLGCMLYTLVVGKPPFDTDAVKSTLTRVAMADYDMPTNLSNNVKDLIDKLLKKNPKERINLKDIPHHPFITSLKTNKTSNISDIQDKVGQVRELLGECMIDSGVGKTLSSYSQARIRSHSEERLCTTPMLSSGFGPFSASAISAKSKATSEPITKMRSLQKRQLMDQFPKIDSVFYDMSPPQSSRILSQNVQHSDCESCCESRRQKVVEKQRRKKKSSEHLCNGEGNEEVAKLQVPRLSTERLQPTRHKSKTAILTILENGEVCIEFIKRRNGVEKIDEVCRISGDGLRVILYKPSSPLEIGSQPPPLPSHGADSIYSYENLPLRHHKKYIYASRFVQLVRGKTPKITLYTQHAKCLFMENGPHPDCEVHFYNGVKVTFVNGTVKITEGGNTYVEGEFPTHLDEFYEHYSNSYKRCLILESALQSLESATGHPNFPIIIGRRPCSALNDRPCLQGKENVSHTTNSIPIMPSFDAMYSVGSTITSRSRKMNSVHSTNCDIEKVTVPGIGIAMELPSGDIKIDYKDGSSLTVITQNCGGGISRHIARGGHISFLYRWLPKIETKDDDLSEF
ncbi:PREDICTED: serine/threonine-protein kinase PLK4 isoform X2 [Polistes dominula]|uniref:Serine/threonine-protein kinase SAK n=1 Tax=Polistes dominula TaxID=743375 RepID=A0ABM1IUW6_POLDO|nr:PREDICTED: serine/threonine-protein kinase PLK4 isoform X2 [Polistes dominula]